MQTPSSIAMDFRNTFGNLRFLRKLFLVMCVCVAFILILAMLGRVLADKFHVSVELTYASPRKLLMKSSVKVSSQFKKTETKATRMVTTTARVPTTPVTRKVTTSKPGSRTKSSSKVGSAKISPSTPSPRSTRKPGTAPARKEPTPAKSPSEAKPAARKSRYLVYLCDVNRWCGGMGDRQRGILGTMALAHVLKRSFAIVMTSPCDLRRFYQPNAYDWNLDPQVLPGLSEVVVDGFHPNFTRILLAGQIEKAYPEDVIYLKTNDDLVNKIVQVASLKSRLPAWAGKSWFVHDTWWRLMKPTQHVEHHVTELFRNVSGPKTDKDLICAHVRIARNPTMPNDGDTRYSLKEMKILWDFVQPFVANGSYFYLASDSEQVRQMARDRFKTKLLEIKGTLLHIDRQRSASGACAAFEMAVVEQLVLSRCRRLVVSASNFSYKAAQLRGHNRHLFRFFNYTVSPYTVGV